MSRTKIRILIMLLLPLLSNAQQQMDINDLVENALGNSYNIIEARYQSEISKQNTNEAWSTILPQASAKVDYKNNFELPVMIVPGEMFGAPGEEIEAQFGKAQSLDAGISINTQLFNLYSIYNISVSKKAEDLYKLSEIKTEEDIIYNTYSLYYNLLLLYKSQYVINNNLESITELYNSTSGLVESGMALQTDLDRIYLILSDLDINKSSIKNNIEIQKRYLGFYTGIESSTNWDIDTTGSNRIFTDLSLTDWGVNNLSYNSVVDYQLLNKQLEINDFQLKSQKSKYLPTLSAFYTNNYQAQSDEFNFLSNDARYNNYSLGGIQLSIPLFTGGRTNANIQKAKINTKSTINKINQVEESIQIEYTKAIQNYETNYNQCHSQRKNKSLAHDIFKQTDLKYREGLASLTDVLLAENDVRESELEYAKYCLQLKACELEILKVSGELKTLINKTK